MGGSGNGYGKGGKMTEGELSARHKGVDGDAYMFDVEYEKLKKEQERLEKEYEKEREEYMRISDQLRQEMLNGTATGAEMERFMSALTEKGVMLQQQQAQMQQDIDDLASKRADIDAQMNELRRKAFSGSTSAYQAVDKNADYKGFKLDNMSGRSYANARVVEMTPIEYLRRVAFDVRGNGMDDVIRNASPSAVERYMRAMLRGTRYGAPRLNYRGGKSVGDERALAALFNGYQRIPVMILE